MTFVVIYAWMAFLVVAGLTAGLLLAHLERDERSEFYTWKSADGRFEVSGPSFEVVSAVVDDYEGRHRLRPQPEKSDPIRPKMPDASIRERR